MSTNKAPSEGQKVDLGQNAPTKTEGTGAVPSGSLAAESAREGGEFANNPSSRTENVSAGGNSSSRSENASSNNTSSRSENTGSSNTESATSAGTAPTYVNAQYIKESGPHGKNITEGFDDSKTEDGIKKAFEAAPGSINDPSRQAELQFELNQNAQSRGAGPKQGELTNETKYDVLDANKSA